MSLTNNNARPGKRWRVLSADDDPIMRELMQAKIGDDLDVVCVEDGELAWGKLLDEPFDLAIIDLGMPKLDGFGLIEHLRQTPKTLDLPIIVATSRGDSEAIERAYASGATSFVTKPINWSLFKFQVQFVLKQGVSERDLRTRLQQVRGRSQDKSFLLAQIEQRLNKTFKQLASISAVSGSDETGATPFLHRQNLVDLDIGALVSMAGTSMNDLFVLSGLLGEPSVGSDDVINIHELLNQSMAAANTNAALKSVKLVCRPTLEQGHIRADIKKVNSALSRLISNAIQTSPPGGTVEILAHRQQDGSLVLTVRDNGLGIEPAKLEKYLGPLADLPSGFDGEPDAFGLGLQIVRQIAEGYGGRLVIQSVPQRGTVAGIWLPREVVRFEQLERTA